MNIQISIQLICLYSTYDLRRMGDTTFYSIDKVHCMKYIKKSKENLGASYSYKF